MRRWVWDGSRFRELRSAPITRIVIPNVIGMSLNRAGAVLAASGILFFDADQRGDKSIPEERLVVAGVSPPAGAVIHPPRFQVTVMAELIEVGRGAMQMATASFARRS
jgi:hypothetical protein